MPIGGKFSCSFQSDASQLESLLNFPNLLSIASLCFSRGQNQHTWALADPFRIVRHKDVIKNMQSLLFAVIKIKSFEFREGSTTRISFDLCAVKTYCIASVLALQQAQPLSWLILGLERMDLDLNRVCTARNSCHDSCFYFRFEFVTLIQNLTFIINYLIRNYLHK